MMSNPLQVHKDNSKQNADLDNLCNLRFYKKTYCSLDIP